MDEYKTIASAGSFEQILQKSTFIALAAAAQNEQQALAVINSQKKRYPDARHHCWAYRLGPAGENVRCSDDGEPQGTAGQPMLAVFQREHVTNVLCVVTRYFGGIKLGTGGLVRAYQGMVKLGLETLPTREHMIPARVEVVLDYPHITVFRRLLPDYRATVASENFGVDATYELLLPDQNIPALETALTELTDGAVLITRLDDDTMPPETP